MAAMISRERAYDIDYSWGQEVYRVLDFETAGLDPATGGVCELAAIDYVYCGDSEGNRWGNDLKEARSFSMLVNPGVPIPPAASGLHHLQDKDVAHAPPLREAFVLMMQTLGPCQYWCAHNAPFDRSWIEHAFDIPVGTWPWICTLKISRELFPELEDHKLGTVRYALREPYYDDDAVIGNPHRALADAKVAFLILQRALRERPGYEELLHLSQDPVVRAPGFKIWFGKHKGMRWSDELPTGYLHWIIGKDGMEPENVATAQHWLAWRKANGIPFIPDPDDRFRRR